MAILYLDFEGGNDANNATSFANRVKTFTSGITAARSAPGDTVRVMASEDPTSTSINATFTNNSPTITLASALNVLITDCNVAWTASANVTCNTTLGLYLSTTGSARAQIAAGFTTGKVAYLALGGAQDYSAYQGITFGIYANAAPADATFEIRLCSDATGDVAVDTFVINGVKAAFLWERMFIDKGSALGASIQSIALYATVDPGTIDISLDNISTTKAAGADCLNLTTLIGKQNGADGGWYPIRSITGTAVVVDVAGMSENNPSNSAPGFYGTTETVTCYIRKPIRVETTAVAFGVMGEAGTAGNLITYSGGWDRTNMSTQTGDTYVDNGNCGSRFLEIQSFTRVDKIHPVRFSVGLYCAVVTDFEVGEYRPISVSIALYWLGAERGKYTTIAATGCNSLTGGCIAQHMRIVSLTMTNMSKSTSFLDAAMYLGDGSSSVIGLIIESLILRGCNSYGYSWNQGARHSSLEIWSIDVQYCKGAATWAWFVDVGLYDYRFGTVDIRNCQTNFYFGGGYGRIDSLTVASPLGANSIDIGGTAANMQFGEHLVRSSSIISGALSIGATWSPADSWVFFQNYNGVAGDHRGYYDTNGAKIATELGANRHTASGIGWRLDCLRADYGSEFPIQHKICDLVLESGVPSTIKLFVKRSNLGISARLKVYGGEVNGVSETSDVAVAAAGTWEELSITVTPSEYDQIGVWLDVWGGTTYSVYIDDFTVI